MGLFLVACFLRVTSSHSMLISRSHLRFATTIAREPGPHHEPSRPLITENPGFLTARRQSMDILRSTRKTRPAGPQPAIKNWGYQAMVSTVVSAEWQRFSLVERRSAKTNPMNEAELIQLQLVRIIGRKTGPCHPWK